MGVDLEQSFKEVTAFFGQVLGEREWSELVFLVGLRKRRLYGQHLVHQDTYTPAVDFVVIVIPLGNLR